MDTYLAFLIGEEMKKETEGSTKTKVVKRLLPYLETIKDFDFPYQPGLKEKEVIKDSAAWNSWNK